MKALIEIKEGEKPYKTAISQWLRDEDGALVFKVISKIRSDGNVEFICYIQRSDGLKRVMQHISFSEENFWDVMNAFQESLIEHFPKIKFSVQNVNLTDPIGYRVRKDTKVNFIKLQIINWFESKINSLKTLFYK